MAERVRWLSLKAYVLSGGDHLGNTGKYNLAKPCPTKLSHQPLGPTPKSSKEKRFKMVDWGASVTMRISPRFQISICIKFPVHSATDQRCTYVAVIDQISGDIIHISLSLSLSLSLFLLPFDGSTLAGAFSLAV